MQPPSMAAHAAAAGIECPAIGPLARLSAAEMLAGYAAGRFTPSDVIEQVIAALQATDRLCRVIATPMFDQARADAAGATRAWRGGTPQGALTGVPVTVKDLIFVAGVPARGGAPAFEQFVPEVDAAVVAALRRAGAVITCKTTTCESGYKLTADSPLTGITRNPWRLDRTSGGSSGGGAAALAAGCGPLAVGTDGVGSIRVPSSFCGVFGIKPTFGLVSRAPGFFPPAWATLAHTGPMARSVRDAALLLEVLAGHDVRDAASLPLPPPRFALDAKPLTGLRVGCSADFGFAAVAPAVRAAFSAALGTLADLGADVIDEPVGIDPQALDRTLKPIAYTEQAAAVAGREALLERSDRDYREVIKFGRRYRGTDYVEATYRRAQLRGRFVEAFGRVDLLVTPSVAVTAFAAGTLGVERVDGHPVDPHLGWSPFSWPINLAGLPAGSVPCGFDADGLPIGVQLIAPWLEERRIFRVAAALETALPWGSTWPTFASG
jgi:aspartyl-tRNA(Asn)/glutamyl-tRNA(Gln) amidotransferase subunit A